jgi:hypothetical protein
LGEGVLVGGPALERVQPVDLGPDRGDLPAAEDGPEVQAAGAAVVSDPLLVEAPVEPRRRRPVTRPGRPSAPSAAPGQPWVLDSWPVRLLTRRRVLGNIFNRSRSQVRS